MHKLRHLEQKKSEQKLSLNLQPQAEVSILCIPSLKQTGKCLEKIILFDKSQISFSSLQCSKQNLLMSSPVSIQTIIKILKHSVVYKLVLRFLKNTG